MSEIAEYKIFAIRYATRAARRTDHFIGGDPHDGPMPMDYFVWVVAGASRVSWWILVSRRRPRRGADASFCVVRSKACAKLELSLIQLLT